MTTRRTRAFLLLAVFAVLGMAASLDAPLIMQNVSPSAPLGLYRLAGGRPEVGEYLAFRAEGPAFARITETTGLPMPTIPMLKPVAAVADDHVCYDPIDNAFRINDGPVINFQDRAYQGRALPTWRGCRRLAPGEAFVLSTRIANSLDSRFYGPVGGDVVLGAYKPLWTDADAAPAADGRL